MKKLLELQKKLITFKKDGTNPHFKSKYLTLDNLLDTILPECNELWLLVRHEMKNNIVITTVSDDIYSITSEFPITDLSNPQKVWSAITYAKRYNLGMIFNIVTDDDDDWNKASEKSREKFVFWQEQLDNFKKDRRKHKDKLTTHTKAIEFIKTANYTISDEISNLLKDFYDNNDTANII